jgi:tetratricopeptide (TPR) repeat protein
MNSKLLLFLATVLLLWSVRFAQASPQPDVLPLSTKSAKAHRLMDKVWDLEADQVEQAKACVVLRKIVRIDPNFAIAHEILAQFSLDPAEQVSEQKRAFATKGHATPAEQNMVDWFQSAADHDWISAITNMNQLLKEYPHDRWVVLLGNYWLGLENQYDRAAEVYERSGILDSPGLDNNAAYTYANMRQFDKALALMDRYVAALPRDANPQDSYAEILRMAGHYNQSIEHYRAALAINPKFYSSQFGIADTYMLKGEQERARREYEIGFRKFAIPALHRVQWKNREAFTYIRDGDLEGANKAFRALADYAHANQMGQMEADTYRQMAIYQPDPQQALTFLNKAEVVIREGKNTMAIAVQQELAEIMRARVELAVKQGDSPAARAELSKLETLSDGSDDKVIEAAYHGAAGAALFAEHKYNEAISHLEEDTNNPLSLRLLAAAYSRTGDRASAKHTSEVLASVNDPTLEQALVVPSFRECLENPNCDSTMKNASLLK